MEKTMKSFSQRTKEGLCKHENTKNCCALAELCGILFFAARYKSGELRITSETRCILERFAWLLHRCFGITPQVCDGRSSFYCTISNLKLIDRIYTALGAENTGRFIPPPDAVKNECCRNAFLRGAFLGGGTVIDPSKNYNIEFVTGSADLCKILEDVLHAAGLDFKQTVRKGSFVMYAKNSDTICDTLTVIGAYSAQMEMLNVKIEREVRNDLNRAANSETANMDKVITAAIKQIRAIDLIEERLGLENLPEELREAARLRVENKDLSLEALGKRFEPPLTKSGVNHRLKKLIEIADKL